METLTKISTGIFPVDFNLKIMKKSIFITLIFVSCLFFSQEKNIEIDYVFSKKMSKKDSSKITQLYKLIIKDNISYYVSDNKIKEDSIRKNTKRNGINNVVGNINLSLLNLEEIITYDKSKNLLSSYKYILENQFFYNEDGINNWEILKDEKRINDDLVLNFAKLEFGGRIWYAWYCKEYPISEGPYKFKNLPGLVFEIYDSEKIFEITLSKIKNKTVDYTPNFSGFTITTKQKYIEVNRNYFENPAPQISKIFTKESQSKLRRNGIERHKNSYYLEKDFE
jgi:GLPGLI family protein